MRIRNPAAVLKALNEAIHRQHPSQFCTAVYASLEPSSGTVKLALGGHPRPLLLITAGEMTAVGTTSPLLGPFEDWQGSTATVILGPCDTLILYSDGVAHARAGTDFFGDHRHSDTLRAATGLPTTATVHLIETAVMNFAGEAAIPGASSGTKCRTSGC